MIVWIASYPRSGNTYFRILLNHIYGIETYSIYDDPLIKKIGATEIVGHVELSTGLENLEKDKKTNFIKTHNLPGDENPAIYIVRDGRDALVSYARYLIAFKRKNNRLSRLKRFLGIDDHNSILKELIVKPDKWGGWSRNVLHWTKKRKKSATVVVRYEDLIEEPIKQLHASLNELDLNLNHKAQLVPAFEELHNKWPDFFRKGKQGAWREEMPNNLQILFWKHHSEVMKSFGYYFD